MIAFTRCTECARRDALARQVVIDTNGLSRRFPVDSAQQWLSAALDGLAVLGQGPQPVANPHPQNLGEIEAVRLIFHLRIPGAAAAWARRLTPYMVADADPQTCSRQPWTHVRLGMRQDLRTGYAAILPPGSAAHRSAPQIPSARPRPINSQRQRSGGDRTRSATASLNHIHNLNPDPGWQPDPLGIRAWCGALGWVLAMPCSRHSADAGQPCWSIASGSSSHNNAYGICGDRIRRAHLAGLRVRSEAGGGRRKAQAPTKVQTS